MYGSSTVYLNTLSEMKVPFIEYATYYSEVKRMNHKQANAVLATMRNLCEFSGTDIIRKITSKDIQVFLTHKQLEMNWSPRTYENNWYLIKKFFDWAVLFGYVRSNPILMVSRVHKSLPSPMKRLMTQRRMDLKRKKEVIFKLDPFYTGFSRDPERKY